MLWSEYPVFKNRCINGITHTNKIGFIIDIKDSFNILKSIKIIANSNRMKVRNHLIISVDVKKYSIKFNNCLLM